MPFACLTMTSLIGLGIFLLLFRYELQIHSKNVVNAAEFHVPSGGLSTLLGSTAALFNATDFKSCHAVATKRLNQIVLPATRGLQCSNEFQLSTPLSRGRREEVAPGVRGDLCRSLENATMSTSPSSRRRAIIVPFRTSNFTYHLSQLICSIRKRTPDAVDKYDFWLLATQSDYEDAAAFSRARLLAPIKFVEELRYPNFLISRWAYNWLKLRVWAMEEYSAVLVMDSDMIVTSEGAIDAVFRALEANRRTRLVQVLNVDTWGCFTSMGRMQGGMFALRPDALTLQHMVALLDQCPPLRFGRMTAEQDFLDWFFRYERISLPLSFNHMSHMLDARGLTLGGLEPNMIHFTREKLLTQAQIRNVSTLRASRYLCSAEELQRLGRWPRR